MATIITRETGATAKGSPLTNAEVDNNFINLNTEVSPARATIRPILDLDFAGTRAVDSRINLARPSAATYYDANGVVQTVRDNRPRIDFDPLTGECKGLLIEEQRTNLLRNTDNLLVQWISYRNILRPNAAIAPDGTLTAFRNSSNSATLDGGGIYQQGTFTFGSATTYTYSMYIKTDGAATLAMGFTDQSAGGYAGGQANFDLTWATNPTVSGRGTSATVTNVGNGWRRISLTFTTKTSPDFHYVFLNIVAPGTDANGIYVWGIQLEQGAFATSYIPSSTIFNSRASSATYFDSTGVLRTSGINQPRFGYGWDSGSSKWVSQGTIIEQGSTNQITNSEHTSGVSYSTDGTTTVYSSNEITPYGSYGLWGFTANQGYCYRTVQSISASDWVCYSVFVKPNNTTTADIQIYFVGLGTGPNATLTFSTGAVTLTGSYGASAGAVYVGNNIWRMWLVTKPPGVSQTHTINVPANGTRFWGLQVENNVTAPTSYIPTLSSTSTRSGDASTSLPTTRAADNATIDVSSIFTKDGVTVAGQVETFATGPGRVVALAPTTGDTSNVLSVNFESSYFRTYQYTNSALRFNTAGAGYNINTFLKFALGVASGAYSTVVNGYKESGSSSVAYQMNSMRLGSMNPGQYYLSGHIKNITLYPRKLIDSQLVALTS